MTFCNEKRARVGDVGYVHEMVVLSFMGEDGRLLADSCFDF